MKIYFKKLIPEAILPTRKFDTDAGIDVYSSVDIVIPANSSRIINTGISIANLDNTTYVQIAPKSKNNHLIGGGIIDAEYRGEILVKAVNYTNEDLVVSKGDAIGQLIVKKIEIPEIEEVSEEKFASLDNTKRGATGGIVTQLSLISKDDAEEFMNEVSK